MTEDAPVAKDSVTAKECALELGCSIDRVYEWLRTSKIKHYPRLTPHAMYRIPKTELERLKAGQLKRVSGGEVAQTVEEQEQIRPLITEALRKHFTRLSRIAGGLLGEYLELEGVTEGDTITHLTFTGQGWRKDRTEEVEYIITNRDGIFKSITKEQLASRMNQNIRDACIDFSETDVYDYFLPHLQAEFPDIKSKSLATVVKDQPYELLCIVRILARIEVFKGECPFCQHLH